jgi:hypothetical protein
MKLIPPADESERHLWQLRLKRQLRGMDGSRWRVDIILGRYGWYARAVPLRKRRKGPEQARPESLPGD